MMENLRERGELLANQQAAKVQAKVKAVLTDELPDHVVISENRDGIVVEAPNLEDQLIGDSSLRDVAFLMRGVR